MRGLERDNNYLKEYDKLEQLCADIYSINNWGGVVSINSWIENHFRTWKRRGNYIYYDEVREQLGFSTGLPTAWKNGAVPRGVTLQKLADYFHVTTDELLNDLPPLPESKLHSEKGVKVAFPEKKDDRAGY